MLDWVISLYIFLYENCAIIVIAYIFDKANEKSKNWYLKLCFFERK